MERTFDTFIFDLDGTLLHSMPDLVSITNKALASVGFPPRTYDQIMSYVGSGAAALIRMASPEDASEEQREQALAKWREFYPIYGCEQTKPYDGIAEALTELRARGCKVACLSNKFHEATSHLCDHYFPGMLDAVQGEDGDRVPRKPNPAGLLQMIDRLGSTLERTCYVGDTVNDVYVSQNAGCECIAVLWGYGTRDVLEGIGATTFVNEPQELLNFTR